jgi:hypothetical protein
LRNTGWLVFAGSMLVLLCDGGDVLAQRPELVAEIVRKAEANDLEGGFCSSTGWPSGDDLARFTAHLNAAVVGSSKLSTFATGACSFDSVTAIHWENGGKCVTYTTWTCSRDSTCGKVRTIDCLDRNGVFVERKNN